MIRLSTPLANNFTALAELDLLCGVASPAVSKLNVAKKKLPGGRLTQDGYCLHRYH